MSELYGWLRNSYNPVAKPQRLMQRDLLERFKPEDLVTRAQLLDAGTKIAGRRGRRTCGAIWVAFGSQRKRNDAALAH